MRAPIPRSSSARFASTEALAPPERKTAPTWGAAVCLRASQLLLSDDRGDCCCRCRCRCCPGAGCRHRCHRWCSAGSAGDLRDDRRHCCHHRRCCWAGARTDDCHCRRCRRHCWAGDPAEDRTDGRRHHHRCRHLGRSAAGAGPDLRGRRAGRHHCHHRDRGLGRAADPTDDRDERRHCRRSRHRGAGPADDHHRGCHHRGYQRPGAGPADDRHRCRHRCRCCPDRDRGVDPEAFRRGPEASSDRAACRRDLDVRRRDRAGGTRHPTEADHHRGYHRPAADPVQAACRRDREESSVRAAYRRVRAAYRRDREE